MCSTGMLTLCLSFLVVFIVDTDALGGGFIGPAPSYVGEVLSHYPKWKCSKQGESCSMDEDCCDKDGQCVAALNMLVRFGPKFVCRSSSSRGYRNLDDRAAIVDELKNLKSSIEMPKDGGAKQLMDGQCKTSADCSAGSCCSDHHYGGRFYVMKCVLKTAKARCID